MNAKDTVHRDITRRMLGLLICGGIAAIAASALAGDVETRLPVVFFGESFEDADLAKRGWYDGSRFRVVGDAMAGKGCIEYEWSVPQSKVRGSSPVRRLFEPTDEIAIRFYLKLSKG